MTVFDFLHDSQKLNGDLAQTLVFLSVVAILGIVYSIRVILKGKAHFERVDRQGGSPLLSKDLMEAAYWFFQPLGKFLIFCRITPNQVSWISLILGFLSGACLAFGHFGIGALMAALSAALDALDGMVARATGAASDAGEVLDATVDRYNEFFFLAGLSIYYREVPVLLILSLLAMMGSFMVSYSTAKAEALQIDPPKSSMRRPERAVYLIAGAALSPITIPWLERVREFQVPIGHPMVVALCIVSVLANVSAIERLWAIAQAIRAREAKVAATALEENEQTEERRT